MGMPQHLCSASLALYSEVVPGASLRECLASDEPLEYFDKGSFVGKTKFRREEHTCRLKSPAFAAGEMAVQWIMERVTVLDLFWRLQREGALEAQLSFEVTSEDGHFPSLRIGVPAIAWLHRLGAVIDVDILY